MVRCLPTMRSNKRFKLVTKDHVKPGWTNLLFNLAGTGNGELAFSWNLMGAVERCPLELTMVIPWAPDCLSTRTKLLSLLHVDTLTASPRQGAFFESQAASKRLANFMGKNILCCICRVKTANLRQHTCYIPVHQGKRRSYITSQKGLRSGCHSCTKQSSWMSIFDTNRTHCNESCVYGVVG